MVQNTENLPIWGTGRRKNSVARVRLFPGSGKISVNEKTIDDFFGGLERHKKIALRPVEIFPGANGFDVNIIVTGGGVTGQAGAISHGLARAILKAEPSLKANIRKEGLLTRDPRMVERKKSGRPKARKRFQFSKR